MFPQESDNNKSQRSSYSNRPQRYNNRPQRPYNNNNKFQKPYNNNKFQRPYNDKFQKPYNKFPRLNHHHQRSSEYNTYNNNPFDFYRNGTNSKGNHWSHRGPSKARGGGNYHYSNKHSYYYQNSNGSTYYKHENGRTRYTSPSRNPRINYRRHEKTSFRTT